LQNYIQSYPSITSNSNQFDTEQFSIIHLNGIAYARSTMESDKLCQFPKKDETTVNYLLSIYKSLHSFPFHNEIGGNKLLSFAWEYTNPDYTIAPNDTINKALKIGEKTEVLVVNGYSFPNFNRIVDKEIFSKMKGLEKVYIQSPQAKDIEGIIRTDLLGGSTHIPIIDLAYWNQFPIPAEWSQQSKSDLTRSLLNAIEN
jgi:hypothetical protein